MTQRHDGRRPDQGRPVSIDTGVAPYAEGSCIIATGQTRVLCTASVVAGVPAWRERSGAGWVTAEYAMLPRATHTRTSRERSGPKGRTQEIQRLIGRSLRSVTDMGAMGQHTITVDCDVLQADGGTRTASITGACVALHLACQGLVKLGAIEKNPVTELVAAVSCGIYDGELVLDLDYPEDSNAQADANFVLTERGGIVEIQGTAEDRPFSRAQFVKLLDLARNGVEDLVVHQRKALGLK